MKHVQSTSHGRRCMLHWDVWIDLRLVVNTHLQIYCSRPRWWDSSHGNAADLSGVFDGNQEKCGTRQLVSSPGSAVAFMNSSYTDGLGYVVSNIKPK